MRPTPRPATALRVWVPAPRTGAYKTIETRLDGVPKYISGVKDWYTLHQIVCDYLRLVAQVSNFDPETQQQ